MFFVSCIVHYLVAKLATWLQTSCGILHHRREVLVITMPLQAAEVLSKVSTINDKSSFVKLSLVITKHAASVILQQFFKNAYSGFKWIDQLC
jgi:hypothetical protein